MSVFGGVLARIKAALPFVYFYASALDAIMPGNGSAPAVSRNTHRTKGRKFRSQKSRANRRKARRAAA